MKKWLKFGIPIAAVVVLVAWYAFRPERLVVNSCRYNRDY
jgi:hypothetical protein